MKAVSVPLGTSVRVYRNLTEECYSIQHKGLVVGHATHVRLDDCTFIIQPAGRERTRRERRKCVHAFVAGRLEGWATHAMGVSCIEPVYGEVGTYSPYGHDTFVWRDTRTVGADAEWKPMHHAKAVMLGPYGMEVCNPTQ